MSSQRRRRSIVFKLLLVGIAIAALFWHGVVPLRYLPFAALDLSEPDSWFIDLRLAALKSDPQQCALTLKAPAIVATPIGDGPIANGCGWRNAVHVERAGGARVAIDKMTCDAAAAFALWMTHAVQQSAREILGSGVKSVQHMGVYACRNILGSKALSAFRSQHARANAIDVASFTLADGRTISVAKHWKSDGAEKRFLHAIHARACDYFRVALGPDYNAAHHNHFHFDRGAFRTCR
jgi:hypothetical protein